MESQLIDFSEQGSKSRDFLIWCGVLGTNEGLEKAKSKEGVRATPSQSMSFSEQGNESSGSQPGVVVLAEGNEGWRRENEIVGGNFKFSLQ
ncbi:hypothetical protein Sjap_017249 [Stephania japonica]|uniref:Uncharacterized protein n=1 Tax=Stephania japonica TaxID=461633 RepID=A0AAP0I5U2_9MAGN